MSEVRRKRTRVGGSKITKGSKSYSKVYKNGSKSFNAMQWTQLTEYFDGPSFSVHWIVIFKKNFTTSCSSRLHASFDTFWAQIDRFVQDESIFEDLKRTYDRDFQETSYFTTKKKILCFEYWLDPKTTFFLFIFS